MISSLGAGGGVPLTRKCFLRLFEDAASEHALMFLSMGRVGVWVGGDEPR